MAIVLEKNRTIMIQLGLIFVFFALLYYPVCADMMADWATDEKYSHGYLIPAIAGYMIWTLRKDLKKIDPAPSNLGLAILILGLLQVIAARVGSELFLQRTSMIVVAFGISLFLAGGMFTRKISFPLAYLLLMIPVPAIIWDKFAFPMKLFASYVTAHIMHTIGIPVLREGNILNLGNVTLEVADACSGLRYLTSLFALSAALAFLTTNTKVRKWLLFFSAIPIAILGNILRLTVTAVLAGKYGEKAIEGFLHEFCGWLVFLAVVAMLLGANWLLSGGREKTEGGRLRS
ncbi:MAG: exosortase/archaeosortase family protein [Pseudomonadota bacterium]